MESVKFYNAHNIPLSLRNLYGGNRSSVVEIKDAVEDATTAEELRDNLNRLNLLEKFKIDRVTDKYVRLTSIDCWGNRHYLKAYYAK